ncbi:MAG: bestrophin family protein [Flavobacteriales bacterium]|jgi:putative membrane protein
MINYNPKNWLNFIFSFHKSDTVRMMWKELVYISALSILIAYVEITFFPEAYFLKNLTAVYSLLGFVISLLLVFRTNTAYDRWWEGRKAWGALVNDSRSLSSKLSALHLTVEEKISFTRLIPLFVYATKQHLRNQDLKEEASAQLGLNDMELSGHQPLRIVQMLRAEVEQLYQKGTVQHMQWFAINNDLDALIDSLGICERIKNTPIPFSYSLFIKKFIFIYVITMPLAFVPLFGYLSVFISTFVFYALVSMELLAEEIEDPFGIDENDLPTDQLCLTIQDNVQQIFGA